MNQSKQKLTVFMMDLWATVPYYTAYLSRALLAEGVNVTIGSISYYLDPKCFSSRGLKLSPGLLDIVGKYPLPPIPRRLLKFLEAILNMAALTVRFLISVPDIVHVQYLPMLRWPLPLDSWFVSLCRLRGAKIVLTVHDLLPHDTADAHRKTFQRLYQRMDGIICHSDHVKNRLVAEFAVVSDRIAVIPHGPFFFDLPEDDACQIREYLQIEHTQKIVLWQGIIFPYKGVDLLLNAWQHAEGVLPDTTLVIVGTGAPDLLEQIREQILQLGLQRVSLIPRFTSADTLVAIYRAACIVVYPYRAITTSGALATGLSLGKAIVASDLPVFRELLTPEKDALLVDPSDSTALSEAIVRLTSDEPLRGSFEAAIRAKQFGAHSWSVIARNTLQVYLDVA